MVSCSQCGRSFNRTKTKGWRWPDWDLYVCPDCASEYDFKHIKKAYAAVEEYVKLRKEIHEKSVETFYARCRAENLDPEKATFYSQRSDAEAIARKIIKRKYRMSLDEAQYLLRDDPFQYLNVIGGWAKRKFEEWKKECES